MATPQTPRLQTLDADAVVRDLVDLAKKKTAELARLVGLDVRVPSKRLQERASLLVRWAQAGDETDRADAEKALVELERGLFGRAVDEELDPDLSALDMSRARDVVLLAARARLLLRRGEEVSIEQLAALAGAATSRIKQLLASRALTPGGARAVEPVSARGWLQRQAVRGIADSRID